MIAISKGLGLEERSVDSEVTRIDDRRCIMSDHFPVYCVGGRRLAIDIDGALRSEDGYPGACSNCEDYATYGREAKLRTCEVETGSQTSKRCSGFRAVVFRCGCIVLPITLIYDPRVLVINQYLGHGLPALRNLASRWW